MRFSDFLIALAAPFRVPIALGVTLGRIIVGVFGPMGLIDVVLGPLANLIAVSLVLLPRARKLLACVISALPIGIMVGGGYMWMFYEPPSEFAFLPGPVAMLISILISSLITVSAIGYVVLRILSKLSALSL